MSMKGSVLLALRNQAFNTLITAAARNLGLLWRMVAVGGGSNMWVVL